MLKALRQKEAQLSKARRFKKTLAFVEASLPKGSRILDIGTPNALSTYMTENGYSLTNTSEIDLDIHPEIVEEHKDIEAVTAFEIFEHLINPMGVIQRLPGEKLFASIPMRLWFSKAYRNKNNEWDQHYHEFEDWQFDWLLKKSGWEVIRSEKWTNPALIPGFRPILRSFTPRYYIVEAKRI
ncbi:methyltransferase [Roseivirga sp. E12]|uniref:methyltransferase n=1 Tax=Roseivirga sp. E12 TaxID=2819237 RepID=UPI001ABC4785|nr:methyltransferase [Roseivirga sp. E12]MBO3697993.1 methyltransferase [Roseivirga sp. E12]